MTVSVVGLLLLKYYKSLRARLFYDKIDQGHSHKATHIYVIGSNKEEEISAIREGYFFFRYLKYELAMGECLPVGLHYVDTIHHYLTPEYLKTGLSFDEFEEREQLYGRN